MKYLTPEPYGDNGLNEDGKGDENEDKHTGK